MKNQTYQLSAQGIERLKKFKRDVLAGDFTVEDKGLYFVVTTDYSANCVFTRDKSKVVELTLRDIDSALSNPVQKKLHNCGSTFYCSLAKSSAGLLRTDITTPAQRALESLAKRLNQGSYANA